MGVGLRRRGGRAGHRRARARQHRRRHHVHQHHHHDHNRVRRRRQRQGLRATNGLVIFSSGQQATSTLNTTARGQNAGIRVCAFMLGIMCCFPGTFLTSFGYSNGFGTGMQIAGPILLGLGSTFILSSAVIGWRLDWINNAPNSANWNLRIRNDIRFLNVIFEIMGLVLASVGFGANAIGLIIGGSSVLGFALLILVFGLLLSRHGNFEKDDVSNSEGNVTASNTTAPAANSETGTTGSLPTNNTDSEINPDPDPDPDPTPNPTPSLDEDDSDDMESKLDDFDLIGWALFIPGLVFSVIGWSKPYHDPFRVSCGALGAVCIVIAGLVHINATIIRLKIDSTQNRGALFRIFVMCFVSGIIMTAVGFTHLPYGLALGVTGACLLGISALTCVCNRPTCQPQSQGDAETGQTTFVTVNTQNTNVTTATANPFATVFTSYPPQSANPAFPPTFTTTSEVPPPTGPMFTTTSTFPPAAGAAAGDLPSYAQSVPMTTPVFQSSNTPSAPPPDNDISSAVASGGLSQDNNPPPFVATYGDVGDDKEYLPPPPSYDEVVKSADPNSNV